MQEKKVIVTLGGQPFEVFGSNMALVRFSRGGGSARALQVLARGAASIDDVYAAGSEAIRYLYLNQVGRDKSGQPALSEAGIAERALSFGEALDAVEKALAAPAWMAPREVEDQPEQAAVEEAATTGES